MNLLYYFFCSLGLDPKLLAEILSSATGRCWSVDTYNPCPGKKKIYFFTFFLKITIFFSIIKVLCQMFHLPTSTKEVLDQL